MSRAPAADPIARIGRVFAIITALVCLTPLPLLLIVATSAVWQQGPWGQGFTLRWLAEGWRTVSPVAGNSLRLALVVLVIDLAIGIPAAWLLARGRFRGQELLRTLGVLPLAVPGIALALALTLAYPTWRAGGWLLVGAHIIYTLPFLIGALTPALARADLRERELVAATLGAGALRRLCFVVLPGVRGALLAAAVLVLTLSLGEFNVSFFLFSPTAKTLPVDLYAAYITGRIEVAAATTVWFLVFIIPAAIAIERLGGARTGQA